MSTLSLGRLATALGTVALLVGVLVQADPAEARQSGNADRVRFDTYDGVELVGSYYSGGRGNKSPCAIFLHAVGEHSQKDGWDDLAKELQKKGVSVLSFDLRGHGDSKTVGESFYLREPSNQSLKSYSSAKTKNKIDIKDFKSLDHYRVMVYDIAAAKRFLDKKNDSSDCNSSNIVLIGAESGAALGAMYLHWAWQQPKWQIGALGVPQVTAQKEGNDFAGAVWLSMAQHIGLNASASRVNVANWLRNPREIRDRVPMYFLYGEKDTKAAKEAKQLVEGVLKPTKSMKLTGKREIKDTKLAGRELLNSKLPTQKLIVEYVEKVFDERGGNVWTKREIERMQPVRIPFQNLR
jgi:alpha-beta hydrolase superfamily lysophospholipase